MIFCMILDDTMRSGNKTGSTQESNTDASTRTMVSSLTTCSVAVDLVRGSIVILYMLYDRVVGHPWTLTLLGAYGLLHDH